MAIETLPNVIVPSEDWVQVSTGKALLFVNSGFVRVAFKATKPATDTQDIGIELAKGDAFENGVGGTMWGRGIFATSGVSSISVTSLE